jgi:hypothetical protein
MGSFVEVLGSVKSLLCTGEWWGQKSCVPRLLLCEPQSLCGSSLWAGSSLKGRILLTPSTTTGHSDYFTNNRARAWGGHRVSLGAAVT